MKKSAFMICFFAIFHIAGAQSIQLKFTALFIGSHVNLDSVRISNLSHPSDTVLFWPDTSLLLVYQGVEELIDHGNIDFHLQTSSPNPVVDQTTFQVNIPQKTQVEIRVADVSGQLLQEITCSLSAGSHEFSYYPGSQGVSFVSVICNGEKQSLKILCNGQTQRKCQIKYLGQKTEIFNLKSLKSTQSFIYSLGDSLKFTGWYNGSNAIVYSATQLNSIFTFVLWSGLPCPGLASFTYGGQLYNTIQIGSQCVMRENLNVGQMIDFGANQSNNGTIEKYCFYNDSIICSIYGGLYQWDEVMQYSNNPGSQGICPPGWHIPTDYEWCTLTTFLDPTVNCSVFGYSGTNAGGKMKETGLTHWINPNVGASNECGFSALGTGYRSAVGGFGLFNLETELWSSTEYSPSNGIYRSLYYSHADILRGYSTNSHFGFSVRCFKD